MGAIIAEVEINPPDRIATVRLLPFCSFGRRKVFGLVSYSLSNLPLRVNLFRHCENLIGLDSVVYVFLVSDKDLDLKNVEVETKWRKFIIYRSFVCELLVAKERERRRLNVVDRFFRDEFIDL